MPLKSDLDHPSPSYPVLSILLLPTLCMSLHLWNKLQRPPHLHPNKKKKPELDKRLRKQMNG